MKPKSFFFLLLAGLALSELASSCKEFIEPAITNRQVKLNAPSNQYQSTNYAINFWWEDVEDALYYRLQVVTPGFDSIGGLVIDTLVRTTKFSLTMDPGQYAWRVRAENGSTQTAYATPQSFTVVPSSLTGQTVILSSPGNNAITNQRAVTFKWNNLYSATKYRLQIDSNNFANESAVVKEQVIPGLQSPFTFPKDQAYQWRVRAENETEQSKWSQINSITYDATPPAVVTLKMPANNAIASLPVSLSWNAVATAGTYKLFVYKSDTTLYNTYPLLINASSSSFNAGTTGDRVYWKVTALDAAGNEGKPSELRSFVLQ